MRILFLNPIGNVGGAERMLLTAVAGVRRERPDAVVRVVALGDGPLIDEVKRLGAEAEVVPTPGILSRFGDSQLRGRVWKDRAAFAIRAVPAGFAALRLVARLRSAIRRFAPDVVHSNGIKTHLLTRFAVPRGVPVVWHIHDFYGLRPAAAGLLHRASGRVSTALAISAAVARDCAAVLPGLPVTTVLNAVDLAQFSPGPGDGDELDRRAGLPIAPRGTVRVGLVATYAEWKGHLTLLEAAAKLAAEYPDLPVRWYLIGGAIYHTAAQHTQVELRTAIAERGLTDRVGLVGFIADTAGVYRALEIVVHASTLPEPFGLTIAEAMACGRPIVVSAAGGAVELFTDGIDALGFPPGDTGQLAVAIRRLVGDPALRARLGEAARRTAEARFDANRFGRELFAVYERVL